MAVEMTVLYCIFCAVIHDQRWRKRRGEKKESL